MVRGSKTAPQPVPLSAAERKLEELSEEQIGELEEAFRLFDVDGNGSITQPELKAAMDSLGHKMSQSEMEETMAEVDKDGSGTIELKEFCMLMQKNMNNADDPKLLQEAFKLFDEDGSGQITCATVPRLLLSVHRPPPIPGASARARGRRTRCWRRSDVRPACSRLPNGPPPVLLLPQAGRDQGHARQGHGRHRRVAARRGD